MKSYEDLRRIFNRIDGRGYKAYKECRGSYNFKDFELYIDHVQGDPFASPSSVRVKIPQHIAGFPENTYANRSRKVATGDYLTRKFSDAILSVAKQKRGSGNSGAIQIDKPGQEILERTSCLIDDKYVEFRFAVGLPAFGRRISAKDAIEMFFNEIPVIVKRSGIFSNLDSKALYRHIETGEDADYLRAKLKELGLVAFIADDSLLPRASGVDDRPLKREDAIFFRSPESMKVKIELPNRGTVFGMGIGEGVTLIVGGGYHGKSTLLKAIQYGVYNHIPDDGRELAVTVNSAVKIRAEDGRRVEKVNISPFINNLPFNRDTVRFSTDDASGSTSQAANIIEALEAGAELLIIDEDTSATNFMIRDHRMQELVSKDKEPITPFIDKVRLLYRDYGVSTIIALGGSGDYFDVADRVICMIEYLPYDYTLKAKEIVRRYKTGRNPEGGSSFGEISQRIPDRYSFDPGKGRRDVKISSKGLKSILFGRNLIDLGAVEQLVDISQTRAIGDAVYYAVRYMDGKTTLRGVIDKVMKDIDIYGLDAISSMPVGNYAYFRKYELAGAINRLRTLRII